MCERCGGVFDNAFINIILLQQNIQRAPTTSICRRMGLRMAQCDVEKRRDSGYPFAY